MAKDVAAVTAASHQAKTKLALQEETARLYRRALEQGLGERDLGRLIELYETAGRSAGRS